MLMELIRLHHYVIGYSTQFCLLLPSALFMRVVPGVGGKEE